MRIVAHNGARILGGAERATVSLLRGLSDRGHDVLLLCNDEIVRREAVARGIRADILEIGGDVALPHALRLARVLGHDVPDAFIIGTWKKLFLASLGARLAKVPRVVARVGLESDTPRSAKYRFALRRWVDGVAVNGERMRVPFVGLHGFGEGKVTLIHNGVWPPARDAETGALRQQLGIPDDAFVAGTVARLARQKRIDRLIDAIALTDRSIHCIVTGDGDEREMLEASARQHGLSGRVHFTGDRDDVSHVLASFDAFVVASDREGLSNSMLEAMASGVPVISTPVSGATDAIDGDPPAGIVTRFDSGSIATALESLRLDPARRMAMGVAGRVRAETTFSFEIMLDTWERFLAQPSVR
ncbi:MAG: glycosyltransferase [Gemmatimonadaceae bacterium]